MPKNARSPIAIRYCTYCGKELSRHVVSNKEHAVGRQFFPEPRPSDLHKVIVPSCRTCNEAPKKDEDYLRGLLSLSKAALSDTGKRIHPVAMRALEKDDGLRRAIRQRIERDVELRSPSGVYLGRAMTQTIAWDRVKRVLEKWVRGLERVRRAAGAGGCVRGRDDATGADEYDRASEQAERRRLAGYLRVLAHARGGGTDALSVGISRLGRDGLHRRVESAPHGS